MIRYVGVAVAVVGTGAAAPGGVNWLIRRFGESRRSVVIRIRSWLAQVFPSFAKSVTVQVGTAMATATALPPEIVVRRGWEEFAPMIAKIERLRLMLGDLNQELRRLEQRLDQEVVRVRTDMEEVLTEIRESIQRLSDHVYASERDSARADARGILLLGLGVVMTGIPDGLAHFPPVGWCATGLTAGIALGILDNIRRRPA